MAKRNDITAAHFFFKGTDKTIYWDVVDSANAAQVMTGWTLSWKMYPANGSGNALLTKTPAISNGDGTDDRATVTIADTDTSALPAGNYLYELLRTDAGFQEVLSFGDLVMLTTKAQS